MGYIDRFRVNIGAGVAALGGEGDKASGAVTTLSSELLLGVGSGHVALLLTGRLFVKDWGRWIMLTDNAFLYGGIGFRYEFGRR